MKMCSNHWAMMKKAVDDRGMSQLVARGSKEASDNMVKKLRGEETPFDPLMSLNWHFTNEAMRCGGLYLMSAPPDGRNNGHYCPICEFVEHSEGFEPQSAIDGVADQIATHCRNEGLIPKIS